HLAKAQAYGGHQQHETEADAKHVRDAAAHAEVHARGEQHHVVGAWRHRGDEGEGDEGEQQFGGHGRSPVTGKAYCSTVTASRYSHGRLEPYSLVKRCAAG